MTPSELGRLLGGAGVDDVLVVGFVYGSEQPPCFHALYRTFFFECRGTLLRLSVLGDTGRMLVSKSEAVSCDADLDDDMQPAYSSVRQAVLDDSDGPNRLAFVHLWDVRDVAGGIECSAARFDLANGQKVFVDPSYHFGIRLGGVEQQSVWLENSSRRVQGRVEIDVSKAQD